MTLLRFGAAVLMLDLMCLCTCFSKIDDSIHYVMSYDNLKNAPDGEDMLRENENEQRVAEQLIIRTRDNENYVCHLPHGETEEMSPNSQYTGPSPSELIAPLYKEKVCSLRFESYWAYEVCHGQYVMQYHENKDLKSRTEYYLGNMQVDYATLSSKIEHLNPPKRQVGSEQRPYFSVLYTQGTACDITGKPRTTTVMYVCDEKARNQIFSQAEVSSCTYEVVVLTNKLCSHPAYRAPPKKEFEIVCYNTDGTEGSKPLSLLQLEQHHEGTFKREYIITNDQPTEDDYDESVEKAIEEFQRQKEETQEMKLAGTKKEMGVDTLANNPVIVKETVNKILSGAECIYGGQGWWKYEFCYGKSVVQFHTEPNGDKIEIVLGEFHKKIHMAWVDQAKEKRQPKKYENQVVQINQMFTKGDICPETGAHRNVEVRMRCKSAGSTLAISISITEPDTCQYILVVDSERFCEPLQYVDDYGIIELEATDNEMKTKFSDLPV